MGQYTSYWMYQKYETRGEQDPIPVYPNYWSVDADGTLPRITKLENDEECGYRPDAQYRWVNMDITKDYYCDECPVGQYRWYPSGTTCIGYDKYNNNIKQVSYDGITWENVQPAEYSASTLIEADSPDCGYVPQTIYRWIISDETICISDTPGPTPPEPQYRLSTTATTCVNYDLHVLNEYQKSTDNGVSWSTIATNTGVLIEKYSESCGYIPILPTGIKWVATYSDGHTESASCVPSPDSCNYCQSISHGEIPSIQNLTEIKIGGCVISIDDLAFSGATSLTSITIPDNIEYIDGLAFIDCSYLISVDIGSGIKGLGRSSASAGTEGDVFYGCYSLSAVTIHATTPPILDGLGGSINTVYVPCESLIAYRKAPNWSSFASIIVGIPPCSEPSKIYLAYSDGRTYSAECATAITLSSHDTQPEGFDKTNVISAVVGECISQIGQGVFYGFTSLTSVTIPNSVTTIGGYAFSGCTSLTSITIPDSVTNIGYEEFKGCTSLTSITLGNGLTSIGEYAFNGCTSLTSITIPSGVTSIGQSAFYWCTSLTSITIPSGVTSIGRNAFNGCSGLTSITCLSLVPPTLGDYAFNSTNNCPIYVPAASVNTYKAAAGWYQYSSRIQAIP